MGQGAVDGATARIALTLTRTCRAGSACIRARATLAIDLEVGIGQCNIRITKKTKEVMVLQKILKRI